MRSFLSRAAFGSVLLGFAILFQSAVAADNFSAGAARSDITPDLKLSNWVTHKPYGEKLDPIFARALVLAQGTNKVALVSWDLVYAVEGAVAKARERISRETGVAESNIMVCATHNHSAPWSPILGDTFTSNELQVLESFIKDPVYPAWTEKLMSASVDAVKKADQTRQPASLSIGRAYMGDLIFNRRPRRPDGKVQTVYMPADVYALPNGLRFGSMDPTLTVLSLQDKERKSIATLFNLPCHAVTVYGAYNGLASDWPGAASAGMEKEIGGEAIFLQGCAGDIVPIRRGLESRDKIAKAVLERTGAAAKCAAPLNTTSRLQVARTLVPAPTTEAFRQDTGLAKLNPEVQVVTCGELAIVGLPGEPMIDLARTIQQRSPFPHTIVVGYANGLGLQYVGMPGEKARGGYETGIRSLATDEGGQLLVDAAVRLLEAAK